MMWQYIGTTFFLVVMVMVYVFARGIENEFYRYHERLVLPHVRKSYRMELIASTVVYLIVLTLVVYLQMKKYQIVALTHSEAMMVYAQLPKQVYILYGGIASIVTIYLLLELIRLLFKVWMLYHTRRK